MPESTTIAIAVKTKLKLIDIKGKLDKKTGKLHSMNKVVLELINNYQPGDGGEHESRKL